ARLNSRRWIGILAAAIVVALAVGAGIFWATRDRFLLDLPPSAFPEITKMDSAERQLEYAQWVPPSDSAWKEAALLSVEQYFPNDKKAITYAKQGLAKLYLANPGESDRAMPLFIELANSSGMDPDIDKVANVFGRVGESFVLLREKGGGQEKREENKKKSVVLVDEVAKICGGLDPHTVNLYLRANQMPGLFAWVVVHTDSSDKSKEQWKDLLQTSTLDDSAS